MQTKQSNEKRHRYQDISCSGKDFSLTIHLAQATWVGHQPEMGKSSL
ncbi:MAG: hypothetical protein ACI8RD_004845 [Bacillariaceae sp.]|jgi:hypothetical protein